MEYILEKIAFLVPYGIDLLFAAAIFIVGRFAAGILANITRKMILKNKAEATLANFLRSIVYAVIMVFVIIAAVNKLGIQTTSLVAIVGAAGLAVGLALQGSLSNFAAGVILIIFKPFKIGDFIEAGGTAGAVADVQIFNTILNTPDNRKIILPNATITGGKIVNYSDIDNRRVDLTFSISYTDDVKKAKTIISKIILADSRVLKDPAPMIAVCELADSSVNIACRPWVKPTDYWGVYFDMLEKGKETLESNGMTIPFPQQDVHLHQVKKN